MERHAKIIATIGPASNNFDTLKALIQAGMNIARLNFSHGSHAEHKAAYEVIRKASAELKIPVAVMADLCGPKIRVGKIEEPGLNLQPGELIDVYSLMDPAPEQVLNRNTFNINIDNITRVFLPGNKILLDDDKLELEVTQIERNFVTARVINGGLLKSNKGVNLPGSQLSIEPLTEKDISDLEFALSMGVDAIAISFVRKGEDAVSARQKINAFCKDNHGNIPLIAKIERPEAVADLDNILDAADGIMVARGDLGIETSTALVPIIQKEAITKATKHARFVITATQMLESMIENPRPTRAEASDIANAIFDGTDAVMLSGETAVGSYPVESVKYMDEIVRNAENHIDSWSICPTLPEEAEGDDAMSICRAAKELAHDRNVACIAVFSLTGRTALLMSKVRPRVSIHVFTPNLDTYTRLSLYWGIIPHHVPFASSVEQMISVVDISLQSATTYEPGQQVVIVSGLPVDAMKAPNMALLHTIGSRH